MSKKHSDKIHIYVPPKKPSKLSQIKTQLKEFLKEHRKADDRGNLEPIIHSDIDKLYSLMHAIVDAKWESDCDGDSSIEFQIIDRTKYEPQHYQTIPYRHHTHDFKNPGAIENRNSDILEACINNVRTAANRLDTEAQIVKGHRVDREQEQATFKPEDRLKCCKVYLEDDKHLMVGNIYETSGYSWWSNDVEMVTLIYDDSGKPWQNHPVLCFEKEEKSERYIY